MPCADSGYSLASVVDLLVSVTLAPTMPPSVQFLEVTPAPPPEEVGPPALCDLKAGS